MTRVFAAPPRYVENQIDVRSFVNFTTNPVGDVPDAGCFCTTPSVVGKLRDVVEPADVNKSRGSRAMLVGFSSPVPPINVAAIISPSDPRNLATTASKQAYAGMSLHSASPEQRCVKPERVDRSTGPARRSRLCRPTLRKETPLLAPVAKNGPQDLQQLPAQIKAIASRKGMADGKRTHSS